jgi:8-oxo-dGTP pyrophosphatase MutT (NUDIX family)
MRRFETMSSAAPVTPVPAATLALLRDRADGQVETLLIQRHVKSAFAGGDFVFAGGKVEAADLPHDVERFCAGLDARQAATVLGDGLSPVAALAYWVGAIREAFEEVGLLLAYGPNGRPVRLDPPGRSRFEVYRRACQADNAAFFAMLRAEDLTIATDGLAHFAHWITPEESARRFDTRFFAAVAPAGQEAEADGTEIVDVRWLTPADALVAFRDKRISLRTPTLKNLELLGAATALGGGAAGAVASLRGREVAVIRPRILTVNGVATPVLPGDPRWY